MGGSGDEQEPENPDLEGMSQRSNCRSSWKNADILQGV